MRKFSMFKHFVFMMLMLGIIIMLAFTLNKSEMNHIYKVEIFGNELLPSDVYLKFARLDSLDIIEDIKLSLINDRLAKHPYVKNVDVAMLERGIVEVNIYEKKMDAILLWKNKQYLISEEAQLLPMLNNTRNVDLPVIENYLKPKKLKLFGSVLKDENLKNAMEIISTAEFIDDKLYENIASVNLHNGKEISLDIIGLDFPIYFGKNNEIKKTVYLSKILNHLGNTKVNGYLDYLDLRFNNLVYLGFDSKTMGKKGRI